MSEQYIVSARKYRPQRFEDVVGQEHISGTLKNALKGNHLAHSFLFCGPRGVGKTTTARILAKTINCKNITADFEACDQCDSCLAFNQNSSFNIHELDAASNNSVDDIRALNEQVRYAPQNGKYKIYIIDEVHMLSLSAFNAFLKTLEEPPPYAIFILATTEKHKIIPTILSRCQIFDFKRISVQAIAKHLHQICVQEKIDAEEAALMVISQKADGGLRDALSMFDKLCSLKQNKLLYQDVIDNLNILDHDYYFKMMDAVLEEDIAAILTIFDEVMTKGFEPDHIIQGLAEHMRNLLICKDERTIKLLNQAANVEQRFISQSKQTSEKLLINGLNLASECDVQYKSAKNKRLLGEITLIKICYLLRLTKTSLAGPLEGGQKKNNDNVVSGNEPEPPKIKETLKPDIKPNIAGAARINSLQDLQKNIREKKEPYLNDPQTNPQIDIFVEEPGQIEEKTMPPQEAWQKVLQQLPPEGELIAMLQAVDPLVEENQLTIYAVNSIHLKLLEKEINPIVSQMQRLTGNKSYVIRFEEIKKDQAASVKRGYTKKEQLDFMLERYPELKRMQITLGLDFDY